MSLMNPFSQPRAMHADEDMMLDIAPIVGVESIFVVILSNADAARETLGTRREYTIVGPSSRFDALLCEVSDMKESQ